MFNLRFYLDLEPTWSNIGAAHRLIMLGICAKFFVNPTRGSKDTERTRKRDGQTDRRTDRQRSLKQYVSPFHGGGRHNYSMWTYKLCLRHKSYTSNVRCRIDQNISYDCTSHVLWPSSGSNNRTINSQMCKREPFVPCPQKLKCNLNERPRTVCCKVIKG